MEERNENIVPEEIPEQENKGYVPRPMWQVWTARVGVVLMILFIIYQLLQIAGYGA